MARVISPGRLTAMPSAKVGDGIQGDGLPLPEAADHAGRVLRLHAVDLDPGIEGLDGKGHAGDQPAAAHRDQHRVHVRQLVQNLQSDGALPGDDLVVVEGVDEGGAGLLLHLAGPGIGVVIGAGHQTDLRPIGAGGLHLADGSPVRHAHHAVHAHAGGGERHALGVVARAAGQDPRLFLLLRQLADLVIRAPQLEAACGLKVLGLEVDLGIQSPAQVGGVNQVRFSGRVLEDVRCVIDLIQREHVSLLPFRWGRFRRSPGGSIAPSGHALAPFVSSV
jgi:hypothetical protein